MANLEGMVMKYTVVKNADVSAYLTEQERMVFASMLARVMSKRIFNGQAPENKYLVINTDEIYADQVIDIMKDHGHWGEESEE